MPDLYIWKGSLVDAFLLRMKKNRDPPSPSHTNWKEREIIIVFLLFLIFFSLSYDRIGLIYSMIRFSILCLYGGPESNVLQDLDTKV